MGLGQFKKCESLGLVESIVENEKIAVFVDESIDSFNAVNIMKKFLLAPFIVNINCEENIGSLRQALFQRTGNLSLPLIFICGKFFGSVKELKSAVKTGKFKKILMRNLIVFREIDLEEICKLD